MPLIKSGIALGVPLIIASVGGVAHAEDAETAPPAAASSRGAEASIGDIIVTAQKRSQSINSVGTTIVAAPATELAERGIRSVTDLGKLVPGFNASQSGFSTPIYTLRGIGLNDFGLSSVSPVAVYVDEVTLPFPTMTLGATLDLQRVEVLKGPQGTLFGQSSTGGAINYIAAKPTRDFQAGLSAQIERFDRTEIDAFVSGPINDKIQARLAGRVVNGGAWQYSVSRPGDKNGATRQRIGRLLVDAEPTETLKLSLNLNGWTDHSDPQAAQWRGNVLNTVAAPDARNPYATVNPAKFAALTTPGNPSYDGGFLTRQNNIYNRVVSTDPTARAAQALQTLAGPYGNGKPVGGIRAADWSPSFMPHEHNSFYQAALRADLELSDAITLTSITAYQHISIRQGTDKDGIEANEGDIVLQGHVKDLNQELRLAGKSGALHWLVGANYDHTDDYDDVLVTLIDSSASEPLPGLRFNGGDNRVTQTGNSYAVFANGDLKLGDRWGVTAGIRWTHSERSGAHCSTGDINAMKVFGNSDIVPGFGYYDLQTVLGLPAAGHVVVQPGQCAAFNDELPPTAVGYLRPILSPYHESLSESNVSWHIGASYKIAHDGLAYASVSQGYKAGLISGQVGTTVSQYAPAKQEKVLAYEAGIKLPFAGHKAQFNAAAFYYDYSNKQIRIQVLDPIFQLLETLANVPKSQIYGAEFEFMARPIEHLQLSLSGTYLHSKVTSSFTNSAGRQVYNLAGNAGDFKDSPLPFTPKFSGVADVQYTVPLSDKLTGFLGGTATYQARDNVTFHTSELRADDFFRNAHALVDLRAGIGNADDTWKLTVFGRNVFNKLYTTALYGSEITVRYTGMPATYGLSIDMKFH